MKPLINPYLGDPVWWNARFQLIRLTSRNPVNTSADMSLL